MSSGRSAIKLYITSDVATKVTLEISGKLMYKSVVTIPDDIVTFELAPSEAQPYIKADYTDDPWPQQVFPEMGIHLFSDEPFIVYGMSRYINPTDIYRSS